MNLDVRVLSKKDEDKWDEFVKNNNNSTFYHQCGWKNVVEKSYGHKPYYLFCEEENGDIIGIFPIFLIKNIFFGKRFVSVPFAPYGGICYANEAAKNALIREAIRLGEELALDQCEIRGYNDSDAYENFCCMNNYSSFKLNLINGVEYIWENMDKTARTATRKGEKNNLKFEITGNGVEIEEFYDIYSINMKYLGTPVHAFNFFSNIKNIFHESVFVATARLKGEAISSLYLLKFKDTLTYGWGSSLSEYLRYAPNNFIHWNTIKYGCERSMLSYDLGRSLINSGNYEFKKRWGATEVPLAYFYYPTVKGILPPQEKYGRLANIWSKLPLSLTKMIGPMMRKYV